MSPLLALVILILILSSLILDDAIDNRTGEVSWKNVKFKPLGRKDYDKYQLVDKKRKRRLK